MYDTYGRAFSTLYSTPSNANIFSNDLRTDFDYADNVVRVHHAQATNHGALTVLERMTYDAKGRLKESYHQVGTNPEQLCSSLSYTNKDLVSQRKLGGTAASAFLQVVDYKYNDQRWLKQINAPLPLEPEPPIFEVLSASVADPTDLFYLRLNYDTKDDAINAPAQRNGNISNMRWQVLGDNNVHKYGFKYDFLDRVRNATYAFGNTVNNAYTTGYSYDLRGNLLKLNRKGKYGSNIQGIDDLVYGYFPATNQVQTITDQAECPTVLELAEPIFDNQDLRGTEVVRLLPGFSFSGRNGSLTIKNNCDVPFPYTKGFQQRSTASYQYDVNGNQTFDPNKNLTVSYNHLNLPYRTVWSNGNQVDWLYDAVGTKWRKTASEQGIIQSKRDYLGNREYLNDVLETIYFADGRVVSENGSFTYQYVLRDHLGNSRVVFQDDGTGKAVMVDVAAFYPFGLQIEELSGSFKQPKFGYLFNGKELETDFGLNLTDFGNRRQDPATGLFTTIDRFAEKYASFSPYSYAANNPIKFVDVNGDSIDVSQLTKTQLETYNSQIELLMNSKLFTAYYKALSESTKVYTISAKKGKEGTPSEAGQFFNPTTNEVGVGENIGAYAVAQELFHAFQSDGNFYSEDIPRPHSTIETEGDVATIYVMTEAGLGYPTFGEWSEDFQFDAYDGAPSLEKVQSSEYQQMFQTAVNKRIDYYIKSGINAPTYTSPNRGTKPKALEGVVRLIKQ